MTLIPASYADIYTAADLADAERDLAGLVADHAAEEDPTWRDALATWIVDDTAWLAEMREMVVGPSLPMEMPISLAVARVAREARR